MNEKQLLKQLKGKLVYTIKGVEFLKYTPEEHATILSLLSQWISTRDRLPKDMQL